MTAAGGAAVFFVERECVCCRLRARHYCLCGARSGLWLVCEQVRNSEVHSVQICGTSRAAITNLHVHGMFVCVAFWVWAGCHSVTALKHCSPSQRAFAMLKSNDGHHKCHTRS